MMKHAFSFVEILMVIGIGLILLSFSSFSIIRARNAVSSDTTIDSLMNDIKLQQLQSMSGYDLSSVQTNNYGIYFETNRYTLFHTPTYQSNASTNFVINLDNGNTFSTINLPSSQIIFASSSGEITNYDLIKNSLIITNTNTNESKTLIFNRYGVLTSLN